MLIIFRPIFSIILTSPKPFTYYLLYLFIHYLTGPHTTLVNSDLVNPEPLESYIYYGTVYLGNIVKFTYYIGRILFFYLIDLGALT